MVAAFVADVAVAIVVVVAVVVDGEGGYCVAAKLRVGILPLKRFLLCRVRVGARAYGPCA